MDELKGWADIIGDWGSKYLDYRRIESQDALAADRLRYEQQAALQSQQRQASASGWLMPALLIGGGLIVVVLLLKK